MSAARWVEQFTVHSAWDIVEDTLNLSAQYAGEDAEAQAKLDYIRLVLRAVLNLKGFPSPLIGESALDELHRVVELIKSNLDYWLENDSAKHLDAAYSGIASVQNVVRGWPVGKEQSLLSAAAVLRESVKVTNENLNLSQKKFDEAQESLEKRVQELFASIDDREATLNDRAQAIETSVRTLTNDLLQVEKRNDQLVNTLQSRFDEAENKRVEAHQALLDDQRERLANVLIDVKSETKNTIQQQEKIATSIIERLERLKSDAEGLVGAVGTTATAKWYMDYADKQKEEADYWRWGAVVAFSVAVVYSLGWIIWFDGDSAEWRSSLIKALLSITILAVATYATTESREHRNRETAARATELKLRAFDPFIATLRETDRRQLKIESTRSIFINDLGEVTLPHAEVDGDALESEER